MYPFPRRRPTARRWASQERCSPVPFHAHSTTRDDPLAQNAMTSFIERSPGPGGNSLFEQRQIQFLAQLSYSVFHWKNNRPWKRSPLTAVANYTRKTHRRPFYRPRVDETDHALIAKIAQSGGDRFDGSSKPPLKMGRPRYLVTKPISMFQRPEGFPYARFGESERDSIREFTACLRGARCLASRFTRLSAADKCTQNPEFFNPFPPARFHRKKQPEIV